MPKPILNNTKSIEGQTEVSLNTVFFIFLRLGLTSFGGPIAHLSYFRDEFVIRRKWFDEQTYGDLIALCQFLPGPASSQVGIGIGLAKAGLPGALAAWVGFTLPSALALILFGISFSALSGMTNQGWLHGLKIVAVAVVAQAVWGLARTLCPDRQRMTIMVLAAIAVLAWPIAGIQVAIIAASGLAGLVFLRFNSISQHVSLGINLSRRFSVAALTIFFVLLIGLPLLSAKIQSHPLAMVDHFYRAGSLVFGGGHIVLPLLQNEVVQPGWVSNDIFLAGYGAAQAVPGPLFTFAAYLGTVMTPAPNGWMGGLICLVAIFLPSFLLVIGILPFWDDLRQLVSIRSALSGINAGVVGLLLAALYRPVWASGILTAADFGLAIAAFTLLQFWKVPPWLVVILSAAGGIALSS
jgi:chromate transporter